METSLGDLSVKTLVERIACNHVSPGAGAAGAVTLSLSAACAAKAVSITLKHVPDDPRLQQALARFEKLRHWALEGADFDSKAFEEFVHKKTANAAAGVVGAVETIGQVIDALVMTIHDVEPLVNLSMTGDMIAAKALAMAARAIQGANEAEAKSQQRNLESASHTIR
jgi:hypothetical protein